MDCSLSIKSCNLSSASQEMPLNLGRGSANLQHILGSNSGDLRGAGMGRHGDFSLGSG